MKKKLFNFDATHSKPQHDIWTLKRIFGLRVGKPFKEDEYTNVKFIARRGVANEMFNFTLVDLLLTNPYNWIVIPIFYPKNQSSMSK